MLTVLYNFSDNHKKNNKFCIHTNYSLLCSDFRGLDPVWFGLLLLHHKWSRSSMIRLFYLWPISCICLTVNGSQLHTVILSDYQTHENFAAE